MINQKYTEEEFNEAMARLDGFEDISHRFTRKMFKKGDFIAGIRALPDYYNDLNQLMPLVWKHDTCILPDEDENGDKFYCTWTWIDNNEFHADDKDALKAIRDCLMQIWRENNAIK